MQNLLLREQSKGGKKQRQPQFYLDTTSRLIEANQASEVPHPSKVWFDMETSTVIVWEKQMLDANVRIAMKRMTNLQQSEKRATGFEGICGVPPAHLESGNTQLVVTYTALKATIAGILPYCET